MEFLSGAVTYVLPFLVVLTVLVFVHEMGHYLVARWNGVRVEVFSVGFGPEIWGWNDRLGTRWKIAWIPFGGYVKFFGDANATSATTDGHIHAMSEAERAVSFHHKTLAQRAAIVVAGPLANFIYAILVLAVLYMTFGQRLTVPEVGRVMPDSVAAKAGFRVGDRVLAINGESIERFEELEQFVFLNPELPLDFEIGRGSERLSFTVVPELVIREDSDGIPHRFGSIGILPANPARVGRVYEGSPAHEAGFLEGDQIVSFDGQAIENFERLQDLVNQSNGRPLPVEVLRDGQIVKLVVAARRDVRTESDGVVTDRWLIGIQRALREPVALSPVTAVVAAVDTSYDMLARTLEYVGQMITGRRGTEDLGGPLRIAHASGQAAQVGVEQLIFLSVLLSLNLGLINLFPVPMLDGGHLLFYAIEVVRGRPMTERMQEYAFRFGLALVLTLTVFVTWNDLVNLQFVKFVTGLFS